jgi:ribonuclease-3
MRKAKPHNTDSPTIRVLGHRFRDHELAKRALTHRSAVRDTEASIDASYERLEFLGDAVLGMLVCDKLFRLFPERNEGELTRLKALLVNESTLSRLASEAGLGELVIMSPEEAESGGRSKSSILADAFESVLGAIYLESGLSAAGRVVEKHLISQLEYLLSDVEIRNYKGELQELLQSNGKAQPRYKVTEKVGPDHDKRFGVAVFWKEKRLGQGWGTSKKQAEQRAARQALRKLKRSSD